MIVCDSADRARSSSAITSTLPTKIGDGSSGKLLTPGGTSTSYTVAVRRAPSRSAAVAATSSGTNSPTAATNPGLAANPATDTAVS
ncbi:hypothetical protein ACQ86D_22715 [Streptomyces galilaeus]